MYDITLSANGKPIVTLPHNTYYPYLTNPGEIEFMSKIALGSSESLSLYAKGGHTYFLRTEIRAGTMYGQAILALVEQSTAEEEIRDCRKVGEKNVVHLSAPKIDHFCANEMDPAFFPHDPHTRQDGCC